MIKIIFFGWNIGMKRVTFSKLLHDKTNLSLQKTWEIGLKILDGEVIEINVEEIGMAEEIISKSLELGVKARIEV